MTYILYVFIIFLVVGAIVIGRKRKSVDIRETTYDIPNSLDRNDFPQCDTDLLLIAFTSDKCDSCSNIIQKAQAACTKYVSFSNVRYEDVEGKKLHKKYDIGVVPLLVICDGSGTVLYSFVGAVSAADLWSSLARARGDEIQSCPG